MNVDVDANVNVIQILIAVDSSRCHRLKAGTRIRVNPADHVRKGEGRTWKSILTGDVTTRGVLGAF